MLSTWSLLEGDARARLEDLPAGSVQTCVTSPPYWGLRDYGTSTWEGGDPACDHTGAVVRTAPPGTPKQASNAGALMVRSGDCRCGAVRVDAQLGLEPTPDAYVAGIVGVFRGVWRVLRDDGTLWLNLGDTFNSSPSNQHSGAVGANGSKALGISVGRQARAIAGLKLKDLVGIPWRVAFALQADGWYLRSDIIWHKPNPMPESVSDRPTKAHEYLFLLTKSARYYYDAEAIAEQATPQQRTGRAGGYQCPADIALAATGKRHGSTGLNGPSGDTRNRRSVWTVATQPYAEAHFATFPEDLITPCVLAGSREGDTVLDPFTGSGTTGVVALNHARSFVGVELNPAYVALARRRIGRVAPLFSREAAAV